MAPDYDFEPEPVAYAPEPAAQVFAEPNVEPTYDGIDIEDRWTPPEPAPPPVYTAEPAPVREAYQPIAPVVRETAPIFPPREDYGLVSDPIAATTSQVFSKLAPSNVFPEIFSSGNTVEALVVEMLKPMLKEWLDANLPRIVEDKVESEVARIARRSF
ncbi:MAG: DUF2497 domain-containing protein, partial [Richelia sp. CSU_2_1]|nr:DUF2497 domain-containing protein [Richelia sp. CSU_2_1]